MSRHPGKGLALECFAGQRIDVLGDEPAIQSTLICHRLLASHSASHRPVLYHATACTTVSVPDTCAIPTALELPTEAAYLIPWREAILRQEGLLAISPRLGRGLVAARVRVPSPKLVARRDLQVRRSIHFQLARVAVVLWPYNAVQRALQRPEALTDGTRSAEQRK